MKKGSKNDIRDMWIILIIAGTVFGFIRYYNWSYENYGFWYYHPTLVQDILAAIGFGLYIIYCIYMTIKYFKHKGD